MKLRHRLFNKRGVTLIITCFVVASLLVYTSAVVSRILTEVRFSQRNKAYAQAFYLAEAGIAQAANTLAFQEANHITVVTNFTANLNIDPTITLTYGWTDIDRVDTPFVNPLGIVYFGRHYCLTAVATHSRYPANPVTVNQLIMRKKTYTFQHAVFYNDDLEMLPGANMTLSGQVHSNHDIYIGSPASALTLDPIHFDSAGNIYNERKDDPSAILSGTVNIKNSVTGIYALMDQLGDLSPMDSNNPNWLTGSQTRWGGTVKSSAQGITTLTVPTVSSTVPNGYYAQNATLSIVDAVAYNSSGAIVTLPAGTITSSTFFDSRANRNITVTNVNVSKLNTSGKFPSNGLLYATRSDATATQPNGIRLTTASTLAAPLTVVSNDPVYIQGNYNTINKQPAAVIADAVNLLSNNWNDSYGSGKPHCDDHYGECRIYFRDYPYQWQRL